MSEQSLDMRCPVCQHGFSSPLNKEVLEKMALCCPGCNVKINLEGINTTTGLAIRGYIPNDVINEHIAMMKDKDWKKKMGIDE